MNTLDKNPWKVESIQEFSCLKCPECIFFTKEENYFEDHAIANHPLSAILFDETTSSCEIEDNFKKEVLDEINHVNVGLNQTSHPFPVVQELKEAAENLRSSFEIEKNKNEEVLDEINHVNVGDIKKEPIDQDTSEDPFDIWDTNIKQEDENFMSSSPNNRPVVPVGAVGAIAPSDFGRSVNPISTKGGRVCLPNNTGTPGFSDLPTALICHGLRTPRESFFPKS